MTKRKAYLIASTAVFFAATLALSANAADPRGHPSFAVHPQVNAAQHPQFRATPHIQLHTAPHITPHHTAGPVHHYAPRIRQTVQPHAPAQIRNAEQERHIRHVERSRHRSRNQPVITQSQPKIQTQTKTQADTRDNRRNEFRHAGRHIGTDVTAQQARQGRFAAPFNATLASRAQYRRGADPTHLAARRAWHRGLRARFVPWYGPVFWPYAYSDIFDYAFWPSGYADGYWAYVYDDFFDGLFWGEQGPPDEYVYAEPYSSPEQRVRHAAVSELCGQPGTGITAWPFAEIERKVGLNGEQKTLLDNLRAAAGRAKSAFEQSCPPANDFALTPPGRLQAMSARLGATLSAVRTVKPALIAFYNSLNDEQKERFNELGPQGGTNKVASKAGETNGAAPQETNNCKQPKPGLTNLPIENIAAVVKPTDAQQADLDKLAAATDRAASILQAACPEETPITPPGRLETMEKRLQALLEAANTVKPALDSFYGSLSNEQKARFNRIGEELAQAHG